MPFRQLGVATSNLTFFRQIGGTVALAIVGTIFGTTFQEELVPQMTAAGVPPSSSTASGQASTPGPVDFNQLTGTGDIGATILAAPGLPGRARAVHRQHRQGIHGAFSLAVAQTFWIGVVASILAVVAAWP